jgi:hypothetical protein
MRQQRRDKIMTLRPGNYYIISSLIGNEVMFLRKINEKLLAWSRTLKDAIILYDEEKAEEMRAEARRNFAKGIVRGVKVTRLDVFGQARNLFYELN